jgi:hypothetical protein
MEAEMQVQSPEDSIERRQSEALMRVNQCKNLNDFYDVLFLVEDTLVKGNSLVLQARCPYFKAMLGHPFRERQVPRAGHIKVFGVPKLYFHTILEYIYSDHFYIQRNNIEFFLKLMVFADYFILPRLVEICSLYLKPYVNQNTTLSLLLFAQAHNAL